MLIKKCRVLWKALSISFLLAGSFIINAADISEIEIIDLPKESNCIDLTPELLNIKYTLDELVRDAQAGKKPWGAADFATPREAEKYFSKYLIDKLGKEEAERISPILFTPTYFGKEFPAISTELTLKDISDMVCSGHMFSNIGSVLTRLSKGILSVSGAIEYINDCQINWPPKVRFLSPQQVFKAYSEHRFSHIIIKDFEEYKKAYPEHMETIFSSKYFGIPEEEEERREYFLTYPLGILTRDLVKCIYEGALKMMRSSRAGDNIVIFGNTPYFVGRALKFLISDNPSMENHRTLIELPFSGSPNRMRAYNLPTAKDIVTPERLEHLKRRLERLGLSVKSETLKDKQTHFVDVICSGSGVAYVIEELLRDFRKSGRSIPYFDIFCMNKINIEDPEDHRQAQISACNASDGERITLFFPSREETHFTAPTLITYVEGHGYLDNLPSKEWRIWPEYNPAYWQDEYDDMLAQSREHLPHIKALLDYFDTNIRHLMSQE